MIRPMTMAHIDQVVSVHLRSFPGFFLSFLGPQFLRLYYESIVDYPDAAGYVCVEDDRVIGFVCGTVSPSRFYSYLLRTRWLRFALAALSAVFRNPSIVPRLVRAWVYPRQASEREDSYSDDAPSGVPVSATLTSIGVDPSHQYRGVGSELVAAFLENMRARGVTSVHLTTDQQDNEQASAFYQRQGFRCLSTYTTPEGRVMNEFVVELDGAQR